MAGDRGGGRHGQDLGCGRRPTTPDDPCRRSRPPGLLVLAAAGTVVAVTADGKRLVTGSRDGTAKVWDLLSGRELLTLQGHGHPVTCVAVTPDGQRVVIGSKDGTVRVWDTASNGEPLLLEGHVGPIQSVAVYSDGRRLVTGGGDGTARLWELPGGRPLLTVQGWDWYLRSAVVTPDGRRLVAGNGGGMVKVWDTADGRELLRFQGHSAAIPSLAVTADGERLVTGSEDGTAKVWDLLSGRELLTLEGQTGPISSVAVTADGRRIVTGGADGTARVWEAASPGQVAAWDRQEQEAERHLAAWRAPRRPRPGLHPRLAGPGAPPARGRPDRERGAGSRATPGRSSAAPGSGERVVTGGGDRAWEAHRAAEAVLDFHRVVGRYSTDCVAYAVSYVVSDRGATTCSCRWAATTRPRSTSTEQEVYKYSRPRGLDELDPIGPVALRGGQRAGLQGDEQGRELGRLRAVRGPGGEPCGRAAGDADPGAVKPIQRPCQRRGDIQRALREGLRRLRWDGRLARFSVSAGVRLLVRLRPQGRPTGVETFSIRLPPNRACDFRGTRLSSDQVSGVQPIGMSPTSLPTS